ncbi:MurR/RpiR family transcriptional regulator [Neobacillus terrae]|uniref:MurR/RpiR family transcriptional regulator n=1 Tax=Neobacillus terrae TaxID=3034837 RepID=UPI00140A5536|nr:MurR/RpiR family transcriptional regulator [Neobacillus terrae]NHM29487.1 MurR/RpiR family transcriptional regulator [Neobacillus terrae]
MAQNCLGTIRSIYPKLSEKEKKIADYILENPEIVIHRTINEVADDLNLADATVFRFSKRIGFKGFQAMKISLASEIISSDPKKVSSQNDNNDNDNLSQTIFKTTITSLENTLERLDDNAFSKAADLILNADRVQFFGTGTSSFLALDAFQRFSSAGIKASAFLETQFQLTTASQLSKNDVAVIVSKSGSSQETVSILETIKKTSASLIGITGFSQSPVSLNTDVALYSFTDRTDEPASLSSRIVLLTLLDALYMTVLSQTNHK